MLAAALTALAVAFLPVDLVYKVVAVVLGGMAATGAYWTWRVARWAVGSAWDAAQRSRARQQRRQDHAASRGRVAPGRSTVTENDDETLQMGDPTRSRLGRHAVQGLLEQARAAASTGDFREAALLYSDLLDGAPDHLEGLVERGRVYLDLADYNRAMSDFVRAEDVDPESALPLVAIGDLCFVRKDYEGAIEKLDAALALDPRHAMAWCRRGLSHSYRGNHAQALDDLQHAKRLDPDLPNIDTFIALERKKSTPGAPSRSRGPSRR